MNIIGKKFTIEEFRQYVSELKFNGWTPNFVVVHNTSSPTKKLYDSWKDRKDWTGEQWQRNLASYYAGMGWNGCPHLFVADDYIYVLNSLTIHGTHTPSWNAFTWGVETVAEFESEAFDNGIRDNLIAALAILHERCGLNPADYKLGKSGLHFHKEDKATTHKTCPGKNMVKVDLVKAVVAAMNAEQPIEHVHIPEAVHTAPVSDLTIHELTDTFWLQTQLNKYGAKLTVDRKMGPATKAAVKKFQMDKGLHADGIAGPLTRAALKVI